MSNPTTKISVLNANHPELSSYYQVNLDSPVTRILDAYASQYGGASRYEVYCGGRKIDIHQKIGTFVSADAEWTSVLLV